MDALMLPLLIAVPVALGLLAFALPKRLAWGLFFLVNLGVLVVVAMLHDGIGLSWSFLGLQYQPVGEVALGLKLSQLSWFFLAISAVASMLFALFSLGFNDHKHATRVAPLWLMLLGASNGIFLSASWLVFFALWELMAWTSLFIIGHGKNQSFKAGLFYYLLSLAGTLAMMVGLWFIYARTGSFDIATSVTALAADLSTNPAFACPVIFLFGAAFLAKSALFPFHMWPAMAHAEAPDDFSAYLSGVMIKYGLYGFLVFVVPVFVAASSGGSSVATVAGLPWPMYLLAWIGALTAVVGTLMAIFSNDMKRLMAHSTVANVGYIATALATGSSLGYAAALFHTANHMFFKGAIFASLAAVKHRTGEREMHKLGGLAYVMPVSFFTFLLGIIAAAGIPPLSGFNSKWLIFQALFDKDLVFLATALFFASTGAFLYLFRALHSVFLGQLSDRHAKLREAPWPMSLAMIILMGVMMLGGVAPGVFTGPINEVLSAQGMQALQADLFSITGATASIEAGGIAVAFGLAVLIVFVLFLLGAGRRKVGMMDNYTSGEEPADWKMRPEDYHYGHSFYLPIRVLFRWVPLGAVEQAYRQMARSLHRAGGFLAGLWTEGRSLVWSFGLGLGLLWLLGVLR